MAKHVLIALSDSDEFSMNKGDFAVVEITETLAKQIIMLRDLLKKAEAETQISVYDIRLWGFSVHALTVSDMATYAPDIKTEIENKIRLISHEQYETLLKASENNNIVIDLCVLEIDEYCFRWTGTYKYSGVRWFASVLPHTLLEIFDNQE